MGTSQTSMMEDRPLPELPQWQRILLLVVVGLVLFFTFRRLDASFGAAIEQLTSARLLPLALALMTAAVAMTAIAVGWIQLLRDVGHQASPRTIIGWYFTGEVTKYVPGGVWALLGRGELAAKDIGRRPSYRSVTQSLLIFFATGTLPAAIAIAAYGVWPAWLRGLAVLGLLVVLPIAAKALKVRARSIPNVVGPFAVAWFSIGATTALAATALDVDLDLIDALAITSASWVAGFVVIFVPGGIGVREAAFVALASQSITATDALAVAVICRFLFVAADTVGAALGVIDRRHLRREKAR